MNSHLNIFRTYTKENRSYQLENDLTRALAISLQEDSLFLNQILDVIIGRELSNKIFNDIDSKNLLEISIQRNNRDLTEVDQIFAVSLSEFLMTEEHFWTQEDRTDYDCICDIVIRINNILIIIEAKRDYVDCTAQLYNQAHNIFKHNLIDGSEDSFEEKVKPVDLNWLKLMQVAIKVHNFEKATDTSNRFLNDFINLVKTHNHLWLPEPCISSIQSENSPSIIRRIESAINELCKDKNYTKLNYSNRLGIGFSEPWAQEVLFSISEKGQLEVAIYPGNTKAQGAYIFQNEPRLKSTIQLNNKKYELKVLHHIKFTSYQKFFAGLWFSKKHLKDEIYTKENFWAYCGRNYRGEDWNRLEQLFDKSFNNYGWRDDCGWDSNLFKGKNQFDLSFGYEISLFIPFNELKNLDCLQSDLSGLVNLLKSIHDELKTIYYKP